MLNKLEPSDLRFPFFKIHFWIKKKKMFVSNENVGDRTRLEDWRSM